MAERDELGKTGGNAVIVYLEEHDYPIRHRNWRKGHLEPDIVAAKENELAIVEAKARGNTLFAQLEEAAGLPKIRRIVCAADVYMKLFQIDVPARFSIITVIGKNENFRIDHTKEVLCPPLF